MRIKKIEIKNFRLLEDVCILLDDHLTLIVGKNNSGKTSLTEIFYKFLGNEKAKFKFEDFSINSHKKFESAVALFNQLEGMKNNNSSEEDVRNKEKAFRETIPIISINLYIEYLEEDNLASLAPFLMDLDPDRKDAYISFEYSPNDPEKLFNDFRLSQDQNIIDFIKSDYRSYYGDKIFSADQKNKSNKRLVEKKQITDLFITSFIYAQRHIDDQALKGSEKLSKSFEEYYNHHHKDNQLNQQFQSVLNETSAQWDEIYKNIFGVLLNDLKGFGYPGLQSHDLAIKSHFDVEKILKGHTNVYYQHGQNNFLPESYNGLGFKNLIYIILQFITFFEKYKKQNPTPNFHLLFIEEPEVHLHPQMQCLFIKNIQTFVKSKTGWNLQIVITTHSAHIVSESGFKPIRYFDNSNGLLNVKNLAEFNSEKKNMTFLKQYLSLNKCDMFFADKIILIEGTVERLLLPFMIKKLDKKHKTALSSQYISLIEVGGAYAHKFKDLLEFIGVKTLIVTDIDTINSVDDGKKCRVSEGDETSNQALIQWIPAKKNKNELLACNEADKIRKNIRVCYQISEEPNTNCARSFEEAFILKNATLLAKNNVLEATKKLFKDKDENIIQESAFEIADKISSKTDFAFDVMLLNEWETPKYIEEGLLWLEK